MKVKFLPALCILLALAACDHTDYPYEQEQASSFTEISSYDLGESGAAEISAFDPSTKKLFTITNSGSASRIEVLDLSQPAIPVQTGFIDITPFGGGVNSVAVSDGKLVAAIEGFSKTDPGKLVIFTTGNYAVVKQVNVGALPDMVTYSPDGKFILSANEGEPSDDYSIDPAGTISIVSVKDNYAVTTLDFSSFASRQASLTSKGFRIFGPGNNFVKDIEPEYICVSSDSRTAWVSLQENNGIAKIDIRSRRITDIFPLGFKNYNVSSNAIDPSDRDNGITLRNVAVKGMYQPDAIAVLDNGGLPYVFSANEGDVREWSAYAENERVKDITLDPIAFPNAAELRTDAQLGRLNITTTLGDKNNDGSYEELYSFGARSFSVWNGANGKLIFDSGNDLEKKAIAAQLYDDGRSDDKGVEPEGITLGYVGRKLVAFVGLERADGVAIYDISNPQHPSFIKILPTGDAPEGILFIPAKDSPSQKSLLVVSSENDGIIKVYQVN